MPPKCKKTDEAPAGKVLVENDGKLVEIKIG